MHFCIERPRQCRPPAQAQMMRALHIRTVPDQRIKIPPGRNARRNGRDRNEAKHSSRPGLCIAVYEAHSRKRSVLSLCAPVIESVDANGGRAGFHPQPGVAHQRGYGCQKIIACGNSCDAG